MPDQTNPPNPAELPRPGFVLLYVESPAESAAFYAALLGRPPVENSPTFAMFALDGGFMLGLWARTGVEPAPSAGGGGAEIAFTVANDSTVRATYAEWSGRGIRIAQPPTTLDFGHSFVALDPDGHRLRVFAPAGEDAR